DGHIDAFAVHVRQIRLRAEVGLDRRGQDLLVGGVGKEVRAATQDRTPPHLQAVQTARANTDLLVQRGGQARFPKIWRLHHVPVAIDDFVWAFQGYPPPLPYRSSARPPWPRASCPPGSPASDRKTAPGCPTGASV